MFKQHKVLLTHMRLKTCMNYRLLSLIFQPLIGTISNYINEINPIIYNVT